MAVIPSPVLIYGDAYLSKNNVNALKRKYGEDYRWVELASTECSINEIMTQASLMDMLGQPKILLIHDLLNQKAFREALLELVSKSDDTVRFIVWDSTTTIRLDPKTKLPNKTWEDFITKFEELPNSKVVNNGADFTDKDDGDCVSFVENYFEKRKKSISKDAAKLFVTIVGRDRGLLISEIEKLSLSPVDKISLDYVLENTFPTSKEAVLYKFGNALDGDYSKAIEVLEQFLEAGIHPNVLSEIIAKKARWQLAACDLYSRGMAWYDVDRELVAMGKFPSKVWTSSLPYDQKQKMAARFETAEGLVEYTSKHLGLPAYYFHKKEGKVKKELNEDGETKVSKVSVLGKKEMLPMPFMATQITTTLNSNFVKPNLGKFTSDEIRSKLLDRALGVYLDVVEKLKAIRYNENQMQDLYDMVRMLTSRNLEVEV